MTLRNLEVFDNGVATHGNATSSFGSPVEGNPSGWWSDGWGVWLGGGSNLTFDRDLIHDNGQDVFQGAATVSNLSLTNSWFYYSRENPNYPGWGFNSGSGEMCTHPDAFQLWAGGTDTGLTVANDIIGPYLGQGLYPTDTSSPTYNNVTVSNVLFLDVIYDAVNVVSSNPANWTMTNVTFYRYGAGPDGGTCCALDAVSWPSSDSITNSISNGGDIADSGMTGSNNVYYNAYGASLPGGTNMNPLFLNALTTSTPHWSDFQNLDLTPQCSSCGGKGASIHKIQDLLVLIDSLNP
jgi:hypothetical protein